MRCIIFANGDYGDISYYQDLFTDHDIIICADGGANYAYKLGITPELIIGDMDSINYDAQKYFEEQRIQFKKFPPRKDFTDLQLALAAAADMGARKIVLLGTQGQRIDYSLGNLYSVIPYVRKGLNIIHYGPGWVIYVIANNLTLKGKVGDLVSVLPLGESVRGVTLKGFEYPLENVVLECAYPYSVSNMLSRETGAINLKRGILAVFHYTATM